MEKKTGSLKMINRFQPCLFIKGLKGKEQTIYENEIPPGSDGGIAVLL
jgi:hypothetical protein